MVLLVLLVGIKGEGFGGGVVGGYFCGINFFIVFFIVFGGNGIGGVVVRVR